MIGGEGDNGGAGGDGGDGPSGDSPDRWTPDFGGKPAKPEKSDTPVTDAPKTEDGPETGG